MKLVFVHGRSQGGKDPVALQKIWENTLNEGFAKAGLAFPQDVEVIFPFYGDLLDDLLEQLETPMAQDVVAKGEVTATDEAEFRGALIEEIAKAQGIDDEQVLAELPGTIEKGPLNWEWVQGIMKALEKTGLGSRVVDLFTRDVYVYLTKNNVRRRIDDFIKGHLPDQPYVMVGHSLGSVIAYNVLRAEGEIPAVPRFVTVGSPLGMTSIKRELDTPLRMPKPVDGWFNALDEGDFVALYPLDESHFGIAPPIENKRDIDNHTDNKHGIIGYLNDADVARNIHNGLLALRDLPSA